MPTLARVSRVLLEFLEGRVSTHKKQKKLWENHCTKNNLRHMYQISDVNLQATFFLITPDRAGS